MRPQLKVVFICLFFLLPATSMAQTAITSGSELSAEQLKAARSQIEGASDLEAAEKERLLASLNQVESLIKFTANFKAKRSSYEKLLATASADAARIKAELNEANSASSSVEGVVSGISLGQAEASLQQDKAELAAVQTQAADLDNQLQRETSRPGEIRQRMTALALEQNSLNDQFNAAPLSDSLQDREGRWLLKAQLDNTTAELAMLDAEQLSRPMRQELLKAQKDRANFDIARLSDAVKMHESLVIKLRQGEAEKAADAAKSAEQELQGRDPLLLKLAEENTHLTTRSAQVATELEKIREAEQSARAGADRYESDLQALERKLQVVGMSQALGRILSEQKNQFPRRRQASYSASEREQMIADSSLRQIEYEEQRRDNHNMNDQIRLITEGLSDAERSSLDPEIRQLLLARRDLIIAAIDGEESYLRTLGELDFSSRRLKKSADSYSKFISERLLWIRTDSPLSLAKLEKLPREAWQVFEPTQWWKMLVLLPAHIAGSIGLLLLFLVSAILFRSRRWLLQRLEATGESVGNVEQDTLMSTFQGLIITVVLALRWPFLFLVLGLALRGLAPDSSVALPLSFALERVSYYFFGMEILRHLVLDNGLAVRHFHWSISTIQVIRRRLTALEQVFVPTVLLAILANRLSLTEADNMFVALMLITAQVALAIFFARLPNFVESRLDTLLATSGNTRRSIWARAARLFLIGVPCALILLMLLGYSGTATEFLVLMLLTIGIFAALLIAHEFGVRWLRLLRMRMIKREREEVEVAAALAAENPEEEEQETPQRVELDPDTIDADGRKLLSAFLLIGAVFGVLTVWREVLPALGILNDVELWTYTEKLEGIDTILPVTLADFGIALLVAFLGYVAVKRIPGLLELLLQQQTTMSAGAIYAVSTLFSYVLIAGVFMSVLGMLGFAWSQIQWAVAALSVGIGFGLQEIVANFISGLILLFEQPIRVGDTVTVGETSGVVTRIRMRATTIRDFDRRELLVPNKEFITGRLLNWSLSDQVTRFEVVAGVAYGTNLKRAMELAVQAGKSHPLVLEDPQPFVTFDDFGDNSLKLVLRCFLGSVDKRLVTASEVRQSVNTLFQEEGIVVAFPQRDVHLDTSQPLQVNLQQDPPAAPAQ
ncbi:mechanosensitive ion channel domain-containing protein [Candidatus Litorirhabdus singularis]|uniref:mechanosensitive ion channel domain-containing protein n=1 Tax=Candidatus Litorirhabdus singularis TaxID=2518993 RepID=UPI00242D7223|nr:mechanosensitive ion channel domain-containing protein [Candidatus Litorirhabdus singularis]